MTRVVYVNGRYWPYAEAGVHVEDRGFQFADAVYEVIETLGGRLVDEKRHLDRLERSLSELRIAPPMGRAALGRVMRETIRRNRVKDGMVYLQVSRGAGPRNFLFPDEPSAPTFVCLARHASRAVMDVRASEGIRVVSVPEMRWSRCDIKTVMLLPACLAKEAARAKGAREAWFIDSDGFVTEGASSNAWIVDANGTLVTRRTDRTILPGVTRLTAIDVVAREGLELVERAFTLEEAKAAQEAFISAASNLVMPVVRIDEAVIGTGKPGPVASLLRARFHNVAEIAAD